MSRKPCRIAPRYMASSCSLPACHRTPILGTLMGCCARRERPRHCRNSLNEIASSHSSTSGSGLRRLAMRLHQDFATGGMVLAVNFAGRQSQPADVRFGSLADIARWLGYVCFASNSGHQSGRDRCRQPPTSCHSAATDAQCHTRNANLGGRLVTGWAFAG
jgi:hypothetical protein